MCVCVIFIYVYDAQGNESLPIKKVKEMLFKNMLIYIELYHFLPSL